MVLRRLVLVEGDLHARYPRHGRDLLHQRRWGMAITTAPWSAQHEAIAVAAIGIGVPPHAVAIERHEGLDPAGSVEIRPLVGEPQMCLDDGAADGLQVENAGEAPEG